MSDRLLKESDVLKIAFQLPLVVNSAFADAVKALPSADRPQGEWIITEQDNGHKWTHRKCSECGKGIIEPLGVSGMNFCPNCGARMKGAENEQMDI